MASSGQVVAQCSGDGPLTSVNSRKSSLTNGTVNGGCSRLGNGVGSAGQPLLGRDLMSRVFGLLDSSGLLRSENKPQSMKVINFKQPDQLKEWMSEGCGCDETFLKLMEKVIDSSVRTDHPLFLNQLYGGMDPYGLAAAIISEAINTSPYTYEVAPVFTLCEEEVINDFMSLVGYENGEGIFSPGGSVSNMYAICLARYLKFPDVKKKGLTVFPQMVLFASEDSHYSVVKGANWLGLGTENVVLVKTDEFGKMCVDSLESSIERVLSEGKVPLAVVATAGTTVLGAVDPIQRVAQICKKHAIFLHVDACLGGSLLFSLQHSSLLKGIEMADSVAWNAHKMLGAPLQCSMFITRHKGGIRECNSFGAGYLFQRDRMYNTSYDRGDSSVQCGRKADAFKLWSMWKARGTRGLGDLVDKAIESARYIEGVIRKRKNFRLVIDKFETNNVCFWYLPTKLEGVAVFKKCPAEAENPHWDATNKVARAIKSSIVREGSMMISCQPLESKGLNNFFRVSISCHPQKTDKQLNDILDLIEKHAEQIYRDDIK